MEWRRSPGVLLSCYAGLIAGLIGLAVGHDFVFAAITLAGTLVQAGSFRLMGVAPSTTRLSGAALVSVRLTGRSADPQ
jgi:hypothetical protein